MVLEKVFPYPVPFGDRWIQILKVDYDASYPTGGESLTKAELGFGKAPDLVFAIPHKGFAFEYDKTNEKLKAFYADYDAVADGALIEVANTTNLSTLTDVPVIAIGQIAA